MSNLSLEILNANHLRANAHLRFSDVNPFFVGIEIVVRTSKIDAEAFVFIRILA
jgi:hypothetical protein